jgi:hypothetical protein
MVKSVDRMTDAKFHWDSSTSSFAIQKNRIFSRKQADRSSGKLHDYRSIFTLLINREENGENRSTELQSALSNYFPSARMFYFESSVLSSWIGARQLLPWERENKVVQGKQATENRVKMVEKIEKSETSQFFSRQFFRSFSDNGDIITFRSLPLYFALSENYPEAKTGSSGPSTTEKNKQKVLCSRLATCTP